MNLVVNARDAMPRRRHAAPSRRANVDLDAGSSARAATASSSGRYVVLGGQRHRLRDGRGDQSTYLRARSSPPRARKGNGPRPRDRVRNRQAERRARSGRQRAWPGHDVQDVPARVDGRPRRLPSAARVRRSYSGSRRFCSVEDEAGVRDLIDRMLRALRLQGPRGARTAAEALGCEATLGPIDLLLTDVIMPGMRRPRSRPAHRVRSSDDQAALHVWFLECRG